ncbi:hypothetical protein [Moritella viscosa]|uniref:Uncharacterized protein n=1 Tax=Moritella viscosa TaxID=80854 RepID=A0ABY1HFH2_9GAMM|nr:hypothetical protein [Moritella viscosa]SGY95846.1 Putative uncharacterized protein [Moritella viscosa]SGZ15634.1 Putative uncharacterized protein [Moritella viscosa]SHO27159.1 Putative uncharacterized protein [Moritella viscosa]
MSKHKLLTEQEYEAEAKQHIDWLNWIFGITTFVLTLTSLQFDHPWKVCFVGSFLIVPMYIHGYRSFPPSLITLRELCKEDPKNEELKELTERLEKKFHGIRVFISAAPFWISMVFYTFVFGTMIESFDFVLPWIEWIKT